MAARGHAATGHLDPQQDRAGDQRLLHPGRQPGRGYGYQWWTYADGSHAARGIFGQGIFIDPKRRLVIASNANWAGGAMDPAASRAREDIYRVVQAVIDDEAAPAAGPATVRAGSPAR